MLLPLDWDRYYLPVTAASLLIEAYGASVFIGTLRRLTVRKGR